MAPEKNTPAAASTASRRNDDGFGNPADHTATALHFQLVGSPDRVVVLALGAVVAWASLGRSVFRIHLVMPLRLSDARLADFRQMVGADHAAAICLWEASCAHL